jgi:hypothetical protein
MNRISLSCYGVFWLVLASVVWTPASLLAQVSGALSFECFARTGPQPSWTRLAGQQWEGGRFRHAVGAATNANDKVACETAFGQARRLLCRTARPSGCDELLMNPTYKTWVAQDRLGAWQAAFSVSVAKEDGRGLAPLIMASAVAPGLGLVLRDERRDLGWLADRPRGWATLAAAGVLAIIQWNNFQNAAQVRSLRDATTMSTPLQQAYDGEYKRVLHQQQRMWIPIGALWLSGLPLLPAR